MGKDYVSNQLLNSNVPVCLFYKALRSSCYLMNLQLGHFALVPPQLPKKKVNVRGKIVACRIRFPRWILQKLYLRRAISTFIARTLRTAIAHFTSF